MKIKSFLLLLSLSLTPAWAQATLSCEPFLQSPSSEFSRTPDDSKSGLITDRVPMNVDSLVEAYGRGIFPWGITEQGARWHSPEKRGILEFRDMEGKINSSDRAYLRKAMTPGSGWEVTFDKAFVEVIQKCASMVRYQIDTATGQKVLAGAWITQPFIDNYIALHKAGFAHSVEIWNKGQLVAGMYGVFVKGVFAGESMFHLVDDQGKSLPAANNAAKLGLYVLVERLKSQGHTFMDTQMAVGLSAKWGAKYITREDFLKMIKETQAKNLKF